MIVQIQFVFLQSILLAKTDSGTAIIYGILFIAILYALSKKNDDQGW